MAKPKQPVDWPGIKADFQAGTMGLREIARWYSLAESTIRTRAKKEGWVRATAQPSAQPARRAETAAAPIQAHTPLTREAVDPKAIVGRGRNLILRLMDELEAVTSRPGELEELIDTATAGENDAKARQALEKAVSLPIRAGTIKSLALAYKTLAEATAPAGKKVEAQVASESAGKGTAWGNDLQAPVGVH